MIALRTMSAALLHQGEHVLMMQRSPSARLFPGYWAPVGGHMEAAELNDPTATCLREIREETGRIASDITELRLKYIVHRRYQNEIRIQYVFIGSVSKRKVGLSDEGELHWVRRSQLLNLKVSAATRFILEHHLNAGSADRDDVIVGTIDAENGQPRIAWATLRDWEEH